MIDLLRNPIFEWCFWLTQRLIWFFKSKGKVHIGYLTRVWQSNLYGPNRIGHHSWLRNLELGAYSYTAANVIIDNAKIGRFCSIGPNVMIGLGQHPTRGFISTHPAFFSSASQCGVSFVKSNLFEEKKKALVGNDVWIGANVIIHDGVSIGDGAIIAAGSVVVRNVEPYSVVGGIPAHFIRSRYSAKEIKLLENFQWWNQSEEWLRKNVNLFSNEKQFFTEIS